MKGLSRREFLRGFSVGAGGVCLGLGGAIACTDGGSAGPDPVGVGGMGGGGMGGGGMGGGGMGGGGMGGSTTVIDPPPGAPFVDPPTAPNLSTEPGVVAVNLECLQASVALNGVAASLLTYNGLFPGPTIRARRGDLLRVHLTNSLPMLGTNILGHDRSCTNLHTHGLHVSPMGNADNVMLMHMSGESFDHEYDLSHQEPSTINFYHPHIHGSVAEQYWSGMAGALLIEDELPVLAGLERHLLVVKDITIANGAPAPYTSLMDYMHGKEGNTVTVNGQVNPVLPIRPGQVQRWQIVNACNARFLKLGLEGHTLYVVGTEGGLLDKPYPVSSLLLSPGERLDVLVKANQTAKSYRLLSLPYSRGGMSTAQQVTLTTVKYQGSRQNDALPATIDPEAVRPSPPIAKTEQIALSMGQGKGYINGISFTMESYYSIMSQLGTWEVWQISNSSGMDHPFHQHVNPCQVLSISGGDSGYASFLTRAPAWKDVVVVPKMGSVKILVPVTDYDGMAMFHCHIVEHEDIGMMGIWDIMDMPMPM